MHLSILSSLNLDEKLDLIAELTNPNRIFWNFVMDKVKSVIK